MTLFHFLSDLASTPLPPGSDSCRLCSWVCTLRSFEVCLQSGSPKTLLEALVKSKLLNGVSQPQAVPLNPRELLGDVYKDMVTGQWDRVTATPRGTNSRPEARDICGQCVL